MKSHYPLVIFDWEGTIGDTFGMKLMPGVFSCIEKLHQAKVQLAIATNKGARSLAADLEASGLKPYFTYTRSASESASKPDPQMLLEILLHFDVKAEQALMIGDSFWDMEMATRIHMDCIGIDFSGQNTASLLASGAKKVFGNYQDVLDWLTMGSESRL